MAKRTLDPEYWMRYDVYGHDSQGFQATLDSCSEIEGLPNAKAWERNVEKNLTRSSDFIPVTSLYTGSVQKAIVCAAGPSLDAEATDTLFAARDQGWTIIAVDRAHKRLKAQGLTPDYTVSLDSERVVGESFLSAIDKNDKVLCNLIQHPITISSVLRRTGRIYIYALINPFSQFTQSLWRNEAIPHGWFAARAGHIITFTAVDIAYWMGAEQIAVIGNDLCWRSVKQALMDKIYYPKIEKELLEVKWNKGQKPPKKYGGEAFTIPVFAKSGAVFEILPTLHKDCEFIDTSFGLTVGFSRKELKEVLQCKSA